MACEHPFLIVGAGSSGTTLLSVILDRHPDLACGPELSVFNKRAIYTSFRAFRNRLPRWLANGLTTNGQAEYPEFFFNLDAYFWDRKELLELSRRANDLRSFFDLFFARFLTRRHAVRWGEKTGSNVYCLHAFLRLYPGARIIHLVRDGRDCVCSLLGRSRSRPYHCVTHWLYNVAAAHAFESHPGLATFHYEELVRDPEKTLKKICRHIHIDFDPCLLESKDDKYWQAHAGGNIHATWNATPTGGKISSASIGRYRRDLTPEIETLFYNVRLTREGRRRLGSALVCNAELMQAYEYFLSPPARACVPWRHIPGAIGEWAVRAYREFRRAGHLWRPLTEISLSEKGGPFHSRPRTGSQ